jgi:hypothetical protein
MAGLEVDGARLDAAMARQAGQRGSIAVDRQYNKPARRKKAGMATVAAGEIEGTALPRQQVGEADQER